tara:strand:- start:254 stop:1261 length:1008 start_codon:yes stop_codon:yes gene_type:complete
MVNWKQLSRDISKLKRNKKKIVFTIGTTSKLGTKKSYLTPLRETRYLNILGINIYNKDDVKKAINNIYELVDYVFIDCEKKIHNNFNVFEIINYFKIKNKKRFNKIIFFTYKGNDLTVESADRFLENKYGKNDYTFGIIGSGNIGSKLALKLSERGKKVYIYRRNQKKLRIITKALNLIRCRYFKKNISLSTSILEIIKKSNILISCSSSNKFIITKQEIKNSRNLKFILDVGKQSISCDGISFAYANQIEILRLDISMSLISMIESYIKYDNNIIKRIGRKKINKNFIVSGGYVGMNNDLIVDNINNVKKIYGIADGSGGFRKRFGNISLKSYL